MDEPIETDKTWVLVADPRGQIDVNRGIGFEGTWDSAGPTLRSLADVEDFITDLRVIAAEVFGNGAS